MTPSAPPEAADALALAHLVRDAVAAGQVRDVLHLRLAGMAPGLRRNHHQRLVREALEPLLRPTRARVFELPNGDIIAVAPPEGRHLRAAEDQLAILFAAEERPPFIRRRLPAEAAAVFAAVEDASPPPACRPRPPCRACRPLEPLPLTAAELVAMERGLRPCQSGALPGAPAGLPPRPRRSGAGGGLGGMAARLAGTVRRAAARRRPRAVAGPVPPLASAGGTAAC